MAETVKEVAAVEKPAVGSIEGRPGVTVVTPENFKEYVNEKLGVEPEEAEPNPDPEAVAAEELKAIETDKAAKEAEAKGPKEGDVDGTKVFFKGKWVGKHDFNYRLHVQTEAKTKEAEAKVAEAASKAKLAEELRVAAEKREADLKAKYEPPKGDLGPEPEPAQFTDLVQYAKAIKEWVAEKTTREVEDKQSKEKQDAARAETMKAWTERQAAARLELPDYTQKIDAADVRVSDQMREAIVESEVGPKILYHLAEHPEVAEAMSRLTVGRMLREFGKLEATLGGQAKPGAKSEAPVVEISKAPEPITPLKAVNAPAGVLHGHDEVPKGMTYDVWKKKWDAGQIK